MHLPAKGRGTGENPPNRFENVSLEMLGEHLDLLDVEHHKDSAGRQVATQVFRDYSRTAINRVDSPDIGFNWTINPYRGCEHGCIYCYARPTHENLALSCGLEFETKIIAKPDAPQLLAKELARQTWRGEPIVMSGVTDCYQPTEAKMKITRGCLEVMADFRQAVCIVTKSRLILRDLDLLGELARFDAVRVAVSLTTLDNDLAAKMEPRAASPRDRLWTIRRLASAGIPVTAMVAPIIPAINDREVPAILKAAAAASATNAACIMLRLPYQLKDLFEQWLSRNFPDRRGHVLSLIRQMRGGQLYDANWNSRMTGRGPYAEHLRQTFDLFARRFKLDRSLGPPNTESFRRPADAVQLSLFE